MGGEIVKIAKGNYIENASDSITEYSGGDITTTSGGKINQKGDEGMSFGEADEAPESQIDRLEGANFKAIVHFFRSKEQINGKYGTEDTTYTGEFGFDKYDAKIHPKGFQVYYEKSPSLVSKKEVMGTKSYICPYISLWPPNVEGNTNSKKSKATLFIKAYESNTKIDTKGKIVLKSSNPTAIKVSSIPIEIEIDGNPLPIVIECISEFKDDITITITPENYPSSTMGKLIVYANSIRYKTIIQPVIVNLGIDSNSELASIADFSKHNIDINHLVADFNKRSFNQAYIYGELATNLYQFGVGKHHLSDFLKEVDSQNILVFENAPSYNAVLEQRYAAAQKSAIKQTNVTIKENKEITLKKEIRKVLAIFDKHYKFKGNSLKYTQKKRKEKIATNAWGYTMKSPEYQGYTIALRDYNKVKKAGSAVSLDKTNTLHVFITPEIFAAARKNAISNYTGTSMKEHFPAILAYANTANGGVTHVFKSTMNQKATSLLSATYIINSTVLHEIAHSLSLKHTFELKDRLLRKKGVKYKEDLEKEIENLNSHINQLKEDNEEVFKQKKTAKKEGILIGEAIMLNKLKNTYSYIETFVERNIIAPRISTDYNSVSYLEDKYIVGVTAIEQSFGVNETEFLLDFEIEIQQEEIKLKKLKIKRKTLKKIPVEEMKKAQSLTLENYLDYNNASNSREVVKKMERKVFYKWQWDMMRSFGKKSNLFKPL